MKHLEIFNLQCFWKGCLGLIVVVLIEEAIGLDFIGKFIDDNFKGSAHLLIAIPVVFLLGNLIHNFKIIIKKVYK